MSNIEKWAVDDEESSESSDKDQKNKKAEDERKRVAETLARSKGLFGALNERKDFTKTPVRLPLSPPEKIIAPAENKDDDEDDEDEEDGDEKPKTDARVEEAAEAVDGDEVAERGPDEVFETMASANQSEFMDIPHVDHDKPQIPLTSEENKAFTEMVSGLEESHKPDDTERKDIPPIPSWDMDTVPHPLGVDEAAPSKPAATTSSSSPFWRPAPMSAPFESSVSVPTAFEAPESAASASHSTSELSSGVTAVVETLKAASGLVEMMNNPDRVIRRVLTQVAVEGFLNHRKQERSGVAVQQQEITQLQDQQRQANERLAALFQEQAQQSGQEQEVFDQNGNRIVLQPGQRLERGAGGYSVVVDAHGRPVTEAITYGEAYKQEQQREQLSDDLFAKLGNGSGSSAGAQDSGGLGAPFPPMSGQPQAGSQYSFPGQPDGRVDLDHRLPEPRNNLKNAATSPWLWTAIAILIIVYFLAALS